MSAESFVSHNAAFGEPLPDTPHAVSVSLPTLLDVKLLFEDEDPAAWQQLQAIYPRFGEGRYVQQAIEAVSYDARRTTVAFSTPWAAEQVLDLVPEESLPEADIAVEGVMTFLSFKKATDEQASMAEHHLRQVMKRVGGAPSSRRAEDFLVEQGILTTPHQEVVYARSTEDTVSRDFQRLYGRAKPDVLLANSGMSAILATVDAIQSVRNMESDVERNVWVRFGSLYHDTSDLLVDKSPKIKTRAIKKVTQLAELAELVKADGKKIAGVITEAPTNPLLAVPDLAEVKDILGDIPLVVDVSTAGSLLVNALPYADVVVESLTKFASGHGDVMMGAVVLNPDSKHYIQLRDTLPGLIEEPYPRDVQRLSYEMSSWRQRAGKIGKNVVRLAEYFEGHNGIESVYWTGAEQSYEAYYGIARTAVTHSGVMTIETRGQLTPFYDALDLSKGLSFGTHFTLNTPYVHVTHPHEVADPDLHGLLQNRTGLNPRMLRISVGSENVDELIEKYDEALKA